MNFAALLLVGTLFGGMMLYSFGFAPPVFNTLDAATAGRMLRTAFPWHYLFVIVAAGLAGITLLPSASRMRLGVLANHRRGGGVLAAGIDAPDQCRPGHEPRAGHRGTRPLRAIARTLGAHLKSVMVRENLR